MVILGSSILITMYGETMLLPAIPDIIREFNISYNTSSWILTAYLIAGAVMTPVGGKLSDIYGRKKMVLIIMVIYIIGISLGGFSSNIAFLIVLRVIQGIGIAMFPIAFGIVRDQFPPEKLAIGPPTGPPNRPISINIVTSCSLFTVIYYILMKKMSIKLDGKNESNLSCIPPD